MCCLFYWSAQLVCSQRTSAGPGNWIPVTNRGTEVTRGWSVKSTRDMDSGEGRMQLFICCQTRGDTDGLGLGEQRKKHRTVRSLPGFALCHPCLSRRCLLEFGNDTWQQVRGVRLGGTCRGCPKEVWAGKERGYS